MLLAFDIPAMEKDDVLESVHGYKKIGFLLL